MVIHEIYLIKNCIIFIFKVAGYLIFDKWDILSKHFDNPRLLQLSIICNSKEKFLFIANLINKLSSNHQIEIELADNLTFPTVMFCFKEKFDCFKLMDKLNSTKVNEESLPKGSL